MSLDSQFRPEDEFFAEADQAPVEVRTGPSCIGTILSGAASNGTLTGVSYVAFGYIINKLDPSFDYFDNSNIIAGSACTVISAALGAATEYFVFNKNKSAQNSL